MPLKAAPAAKPAAAKPAAPAAAKPAASGAAAAAAKAAPKAAAAAATKSAAKPAAGTGAKTPVKSSSAVKAGSKPGAAGAKKPAAKEAPKETVEEKAVREAAALVLEAKLEEDRLVRLREDEIRKEREREMKAETTKLIREEEERITRREDEMRKRSMLYGKRRKDMFEQAFDDEVNDVAMKLGINDAEGNCQRACKATETLLCPCLSDPFFVGPASACSYVEVDCLNENDSSALSEASVGGADGVLELLLRHGAASVINVADNHGRTPVFRAAFMGKASAIRILLKYGADARIRNKENDTADAVAGDQDCKLALANPPDQAAIELIKLRLEAERSSGWQPPPPEPDPADLVPKTEHSARIGLRMLADSLDEVRKAGKRQALIIDLSGNAQTFLRYRDNNMLVSYKPGDLDPERIRVAVLGALRFGKPVVVDNGDLVVEWPKFAAWFNAALPGLWDMLCACSLTQDSNWLKLVKPHDGDNFKEQMFSEHCLNHFQMILVTKKPSIPAEFADQFFLITTA